VREEETSEKQAYGKEKVVCLDQQQSEKNEIGAEGDPAVSNWEQGRKRVAKGRETDSKASRRAKGLKSNIYCEREASSPRKMGGRECEKKTPSGEVKGGGGGGTAAHLLNVGRA